MKKQRTPSYLNFDKEAYAWKPDVDYKKNPEVYRVGKGEQGVLICRPYTADIGAHWRFKTEEIARASSERITGMFQLYLAENDFVGADMARKFLQMGFTRARRYANYKGGRKYDKENAYAEIARQPEDEEKARAAAVFFRAWKDAEANEKYAALKLAWKKEFG